MWKGTSLHTEFGSADLGQTSTTTEKEEVMTLAELQQRSVDLIRKGLEGSIFVAPYSEDTEITELIGASGLIALPDGYEDTGWMTKEQGASWSREIDTADVESLGSAEP